MSNGGLGSGVLCVGRLYCDLIFTGVPRLPTLGTEVFADGLSIHAGGGAFNTAAHLAALGRPAALGAMIPPAPFGELIRAELSAAGVDVGLCGTGDAPQVTVALTGKGDRAFVTRREGPPFPPLDAASLGRLDLRHLHISELGTLVERPDLLDLAREAGLSVSLDCGWDESVAAAAAAPLIAAVDVFLPNDLEVDRLTEIGVAAPFAALSVVKCGARGARAHFGDQCLEVPAPTVPVVDTTGAGDAFNAGFLNAWLEGVDLKDCVMAGNARGSETVGWRGGFFRP